MAVASPKAPKAAQTQTGPEYLQPTLDKIAVEPATAEKMTPGGIVIPEGAREKPLRGTVIAVGPRTPLAHIDPLVSAEMGSKYPQVGDTVIYRRYAGDTIEIGGREVIVMSDVDVIGIVRSQAG